MISLLINLANRFRRFTAESSGFDRNSTLQSSPQPVSFPRAKEKSDPTSGISPASINTSPPAISRKLAFEAAVLRSREAKDDSSFNPDFITREELKRELNLLRRLIESRK